MNYFLYLSEHSLGAKYCVYRSMNASLKTVSLELQKLNACNKSTAVLSIFICRNHFILAHFETQLSYF